ncbi:MAG: DUF4838 domain-containing protein [Kiritimatiellia bacterium]
MKKLKCRISVDVKPFESVAGAAGAEKRVEWHRGGPKSTACTLGYAAKELASHLRQIGRRLDIPASVTWSSKKTPGVLRIQLGVVSASAGFVPAVPVSLSRRLADPQSFAIRAMGTRSDPVIQICGGSRTGLLYGVYSYLEWLGFRWLDFDDREASLKFRGCLWRKSLKVIDKPDFPLRGFHTGQRRASKKLLVWCARNRVNYYGRQDDLWPLQRKLGMFLSAEGHIFHRIFDPGKKTGRGKTLFDKHPDWFCLRDGKRQPLVGRPCLGNREAVAYLIEEWIKAYRSFLPCVDAVRLWPQDFWDQWCECDKCRRLGSRSDQLLRIAHAVRRRLDKERSSPGDGRDTKIFICAYGGSGTLDPPESALPRGFDKKGVVVEYFPINRCYNHSLEDPRCTEINRRYRNTLSGWRRTGLPLIMGEYYNVSMNVNLAMGFNRVMDADLKAYARMKLDGVHYMHVPQQTWGPRALTQWQFARQLWCAAEPGRRIRNAYLKRRYGDLADRARKAYDDLERATGNINLLTSWIDASVVIRLRRLFCHTYMGDLSTQNLFVLDHFDLFDREETVPGYGVGSLQAMVRLLNRSKKQFVSLRKRADTPALCKVLRDDALLLGYTCEFVQLNYRLALYWFYAKEQGASSGQARLHLRKARSSCRKLDKLVTDGLDIGHRALATTHIDDLLCSIQPESGLDRVTHSK